MSDKWLTVILENQCAMMFALSAMLAVQGQKEGARRILETAEMTLVMMKRDLDYARE